MSEADTVTLVKDLLADVFGYDKYADLTGEHAIRGTYCDLAIKLDDKVVQLIEVKAIGIELEDRHVKQIVDYAANQGIEWVILTNSIVWRLYSIIFGKPIDKRMIVEIDVTKLDPREEPHQDLLFLFCREGFKKGAHIELRDKQDATSRFLLAALILNNESVLNTIRRELRRVVDVPVEESDIAAVLRDQVIKRDALECPQAEEAVRRINRRVNHPLKKAREGAEQVEVSESLTGRVPPVPPSAPCSNA